ncbi:hypothetical protein B0H17DRAFT_1217456 [Mycena rosella]|uniref:Uncharacterized protein n=1 Tax=Mycena rosella TaxID=1033263 RepID=A0AAD7BYC0_MYCRO|nr:hypothetical protein B0H17DRAFT_1217456 [Mycena rosella]
MPPARAAHIRCTHPCASRAPPRGHLVHPPPASRATPPTLLLLLDVPHPRRRRHILVATRRPGTRCTLGTAGMEAMELIVAVKAAVVVGAEVIGLGVLSEKGAVEAPCAVRASEGVVAVGVGEAKGEAVTLLMAMMLSSPHLTAAAMRPEWRWARSIGARDPVPSLLASTILLKLIAVVVRSLGRLGSETSMSMTTQLGTFTQTAAALHGTTQQHSHGHGTSGATLPRTTRIPGQISLIDVLG